MSSKPKIIQHKCVACEECIYECPVEAIILSSKTNKAFILDKKCINCGRCIDICPIKAIKRNIK